MKVLFKSIILYSLIYILLSAKSPSNNELVGLILTWQQDPTTTMTIDWHTFATNSHSTLEYKKVSPDEWVVDWYFLEDGSRMWRYLRVVEHEWKSVNAEQFPFPHSDRVINRVELTDLEPDTEYYFRIGESFQQRKFRTMPKNLNKPVRIAIGGDVRHTSEMMEYMNRRVATYEPDFILWGGDLAYADGHEELLYRWYDFLKIMKNTLITPDGRVIPVIAGIGNHEVLGGYYNNDNNPRRVELGSYEQNDAFRELIAPYYYNLFAFPGQPGFGVLDFGNYLSILLLDTNHSNPIEGVQTKWIKEILAERQNIPHVFPVYHVPAWPSARDPNETIHVSIRENWVPLFEKYGIEVSFENHDHTYKRTYPIRNGKVSDNGIVYIGDGAWGIQTRDIRYENDKLPWFLKRGNSERHFILLTIHGTHRHLMVINEYGELIDEYPETIFYNFPKLRSNIR